MLFRRYAVFILLLHTLFKNRNKINKLKTVTLNKGLRFSDIDIVPATKSISLDVSRSDCREVLVEFVDLTGNAKSKPLNKCLTPIKMKGVLKLRFIMNDMSTRPIEIKVIEK